MAATAPKSSWLSLELLDDRYPALHGLRVLAIVSVVQFHVTWIFAGEQGIDIDRDWMNASLTIFFGMDLFFILSGFLIGSILLRSIDTQGGQNLQRFYIRRISRTFPAYYVVLTILALTYHLTAGQIRNLKYEYIYATNFRPLGRDDSLMFWGWSLALEEQFYLLVPFLFLGLQRLKTDKARVALLTALWALALVIRLVIFYRRAPWTDLSLYEALYFRPHTRFDTLICGIILAFVYQRWRKPLAAWLEDPLHRAMLAVPALGCLWLLLEPDMFGKDTLQFVHVFCWGTVTSVMYFAVLLLLLNGSGWIVKALSKPFFRRVATLGYGIYLVHIPLCDHVITPLARALEHRKVPMTIVWPVSLVTLMVTSIALSYVIHVVIEKPSLRIRERLAA